MVVLITHGAPQSGWAHQAAGDLSGHLEREREITDLYQRGPGSVMHQASVPARPATTWVRAD